MRRIIKRFLVRDPRGRELSLQSERLTDDGRGWLQVTSERTAGWCPGCRRPVTELSELRGLCDACHRHGCCIHCVSRCEVCDRQLCGQCRRGFAGPPPRTVCAVCQPRLIERQILLDRQTAFEQELARHRLFNQDEALRLNFEKMHLMAQFQAAKLGLNRKTPLMRVVNGVRWTVSKVVDHARRTLQ